MVIRLIIAIFFIMKSPPEMSLYVLTLEYLPNLKCRIFFSDTNISLIWVIESAS